MLIAPTQKAIPEKYTSAQKYVHSWLVHLFHG